MATFFITWLVFGRAPANPLIPKNGDNDDDDGEIECRDGGFKVIVRGDGVDSTPGKMAAEDLNNDDANTVVLALSTSSTFCFSSEKRNIPMNSLARARGSVNLGPTFSMNPIRVLTLKVMSMSAMRCADVKR